MWWNGAVTHTMNLNIQCLPVAAQHIAWGDFQGLLVGVVEVFSSNRYQLSYGCMSVEHMEPCNLM